MNLRKLEQLRLPNGLRRIWDSRGGVFPFTVVCLVSLAVASPLVFLGFPLSNYDGAIHLRWTHHATQAFQAGAMYPRYFPELNNGFGSPSFFYYPPLSTFVAALFSLIAPEQNSDLYALAWSAAFALILSGVTMWSFLYRCTNNRWAATVGASLYVVAPYHLGTDLFSRGANAEFWAFVFMPLVLFGFFRLSDAQQQRTAVEGARRRYAARTLADAVIPSSATIFAAITLVLLFLCHVLTAIAFAPIALAYAIVLGRRTLKQALVAGIWAVLLVAVFLVPAAAYAKFIAGNTNPFFMGEMLRTTFFFPELHLTQPTFVKDTFHQDLMIAFGGQVIVWLVALGSLFFNNYDAKRRKHLILLCFAAQFCILMMLPISDPLYAVLPFLRRLQFAWRFLSPGTFVCVAMLSVLFPNDKSAWREWVSWTTAVLVFVLTAVVVCVPLLRMHSSNEHRPSTKVVNVDLRAVDGFGEYVPAGADIIKAQNFFSHTNASPWDSRRIGGAGNLAVKEVGPRRALLISDLDEPSTFVFHQFWFPGWRAIVSESGRDLPLVQHAETGLLQLSLPQGRSTAELRLTRLWPEWIGITTSVLAFTWLLLVAVVRVLCCGRRASPTAMANELADPSASDMPQEKANLPGAKDGAS